MNQKVKTQTLGGFLQDLVPVLSLRQKPKKKIQKSVRFRFRTGTKSSKTAQKTDKILKNFKIGSGD